MFRGIIVIFLLAVSPLSIQASCIHEGVIIAVSGVIKKRLVNDNLQLSKNEEQRGLFFLTLSLDNELPCIADANTQIPDWGREVQLLLNQRELEKYVNYVDHESTVIGTVLLAKDSYKTTPVLLDSVVIKILRK